jgi:ATP-dependent Clp protease ATP-binding subunit ClpA
MYERFTSRARKVLAQANQEARRFNHEYIGTEHLLLALVTEGSGTAAIVLKNLELDLRKIRLEVEKIVWPGPDLVMTGGLPQTPRTKKVIEYAIDEAQKLNHNYIGTEHLLLGLLREQEGVAAQILMYLGLKLEDARREALHLVETGCHPAESRIYREDAPPYCPEAMGTVQQELEHQIEELVQQKEAAVAVQDFERAASLRDLVDKLKTKLEGLKHDWRFRHAIESSLLSWKNGTVARIARAIREQRRWSDFPILADALDEAGCTDGEVLRHCRKVAAHSPHCWVLDLLLGDG